MNKKFFIFGRSTCRFCMHAVDFLEAQSIQHNFLNFAKNPEILEDYKSFYNQSTVPIILSNDLQSGEIKKVGGYQDLLELLS